jgi:hypothetical protein
MLFRKANVEGLRYVYWLRILEFSVPTQILSIKRD